MTGSTKPRDRILEAADELFYDRGIHAVGVDEIVARAGAAKTTLYAHFANKDELIAAYLRNRSKNWREHTEAELARRGGTPAERIDIVFDNLAAACEAPGFRGCPFINAAAELPDPRHPARRVSDEHRAWVRDLFLSLAREAQFEQPEILAEQLILLLDSAMVGKQFDRGGAAAQRARAAARVLVGHSTRDDD